MEVVLYMTAVHFIPVLFWLGLMILFLVIEAVTVGLATIWFAAGALAAIIASAFGIGFLGQILLFFVVSLLLLIFTRPIAVKYISPHKVRTNYEDVIDKTVKITENVNNIGGTGKAVLNGQEWTVRMYKDSLFLEKGDFAKVAAIEGVKLILVPLDALEGGK